MNLRNKATIDSILMDPQDWHVFAHISDDRISEWLGHSKGGQQQYGCIELTLLGNPSEGEDGDIFQHITHQLRIEINPLGAKRLARNLPLLHSQIERGVFKFDPDDAEAYTLRLRVRVYDSQSERAIDRPVDAMELAANEQALDKKLIAGLCEELAALKASQTDTPRERGADLAGSEPTKTAKIEPWESVVPFPGFVTAAAPGAEPATAPGERVSEAIDAEVDRAIESVAPPDRTHVHSYDVADLFAMKNRIESEHLIEEVQRLRARNIEMAALVLAAMSATNPAALVGELIEYKQDILAEITAAREVLEVLRESVREDVLAPLQILMDTCSGMAP